MRGAAHRALDRALSALVPADGATPYRPVEAPSDPVEFFGLSSPPSEVCVDQVRHVRTAGVDTLRKRFAFTSPVKSGFAANDTVRGYWLSPLEGGVKGSVVFLHGWKLPALRPMLRVARVAIRHGAEVLLPAQPFHAWRRPKMTFSGMPMLSPDLDHSLRAMRQAVLDVRSLLSFLQQRRSGPILLAGANLGGLVAGLTATVHENIDALVLIATHSSVSNVLWNGRADRKRFRRALDRANVERHELERAFSVLDPGWRAPLIDRQKVLLVGGRYDEICEPEGIEDLAERWGGVRISWHNFAHSGYILSARRVMKEALALIQLDG